MAQGAIFLSPVMALTDCTENAVGGGGVGVRAQRIVGFLHIWLRPCPFKVKETLVAIIQLLYGSVSSSVNQKH